MLVHEKHVTENGPYTINPFQDRSIKIRKKGPRIRTAVVRTKVNPVCDILTDAKVSIFERVTSTFRFWRGIRKSTQWRWSRGARRAAAPKVGDQGQTYYSAPTGNFLTWLCRWHLKTHMNIPLLRILSYIISNLNFDSQPSTPQYCSNVCSRLGGNIFWLPCPRVSPLYPHACLGVSRMVRVNIRRQLDTEASHGYRHHCSYLIIHHIAFHCPLLPKWGANYGRYLPWET